MKSKNISLHYYIETTIDRQLNDDIYKKFREKLMSL